MLVIDPAKRATMEVVMKDKWYCEGYENEPPQVTSNGPVELSPEMHKDVMGELKDLGLDIDAVQKSLTGGEYNSLTATYYLVADKRANQTAATKMTVKPTTAVAKASKGTDLETFAEDGSGDLGTTPRTHAASNSPPKTGSPSTFPAQPASAQATAPPRVVAGRRRATVNEAPSNFTPDVRNEEGSGELPLAKTGRIPSGSRTKAAQVASEIKEIVAGQAAPPPPTEAPPALPPIQQVRARAHTMAAERKTEDDTPIPIDQLKAHLSKDENGPRTARFTFSLSTTSSKEPHVVFDIVKEALLKANATVTTTGMIATSKLNDIEFEIEVCKLPNLNVVGLRCRRLAGGGWEYKEVLSSLIATMEL